MSPSKISIVVPTWNGSATISACLASIQSQTLKPSQIIVVDNGSTDATPEIVSKFKTIKLIKLSKNTGVVGGRNRGLAEVSNKSDFILFFDHDMVADPHMTSHLLQTAKSHSAGIVTPKIYYKHTPGLIWAAGTGINLITGQVVFRNGPDLGQFDREAPVQVAPAVILVKKEVLDTIGGFDPTYISSWEDTEFCFRAKKAGFTTYYSPRAVAYHDIKLDHRADADRLFDRYAFNIGKNRILFMKKFGQNYLVFSFIFVPIYALYYFLQAARFGKILGYLNFLRGTWSGLMA